MKMILWQPCKNSSAHPQEYIPMTSPDVDASIWKTISRGCATVAFISLRRNVTQSAHRRISRFLRSFYRQICRRSIAVMRHSEYLLRGVDDSSLLLLMIEELIEGPRVPSPKTGDAATS